MSKIEIFTNEEFGSIRTIEIDNKVMFCGKDVAIALGYKNTSDALKKHCKKDGVTFHYLTDGLGRTQVAKFVDEKELLDLINNSQNLIKPKKYEFIVWLQSKGFLKDVVTPVKERKETKFIAKLQTVLNTMDITSIAQCSVMDYRIDLYIPQYKLAIEYDENDHRYYTYEQHQGRQEKIQNILGCEFVRLSNSNSDEYNIGIVMKVILKNYK